MSELRVWFAFRSPYSRLGLHELTRLDLPPDMTLRLFPFTRPAGNARFLDPVRSMPKLAYYGEDAPRMTKRAGLPYKLPDPFEADMAPANRAFFAAREAGKGLEFALAVSDARWGEGRDISDMETLSDCAVKCGLPETLPEAAQDHSGLGEAVTDAEAMTDKDLVFGIPFAVIEKPGRTDKFWGHDRFDLLAEYLTAS